MTEEVFKEITKVENKDNPWFCPECYNDPNSVVQKGEGLKLSNKRLKMPSKTASKKLNWGQGYATASVDNKCTLVHAHFFGPIPGKFEIQLFISNGAL